jgi:cytochrome b involved in lipid metabolism
MDTKALNAFILVVAVAVFVVISTEKRVEGVPTTKRVLPPAPYVVIDYVPVSDLNLSEENIENLFVSKPAVSSEVTKEGTVAPVVVTTTNKPATAPAPVKTEPAPASNDKTFLLAEVARHNSISDCYSVVDGIVYDLTDYVSKHPGGKSKILSICGRDGTRAFDNQHGSSGKIANILSSFEIGVLAK